ncbi:NAD(P)H-dependent oxidoreductase [Ruegeria meonggei]|uniref:Flavodoxin-like fold domain-containing protein n=1 Tax=Ruegeria meonggei TaxID=1446476 RepID=A0A1X6YYG4_9RHOB|nr:NAD(P)H-dependent oxidoreductase [Ruegeria meonggei]SLN35497.1 hypothetical protein RUM8411_01494 [Ruegeria meonggei]
MKCLVVISHPLHGSLCRHLSEKVVEQLIQSGHSVVIEDLYDQEFDPALSTEERGSFYDVYDASRVAEQVKHLQEAEALVLVFPTWWFGFPAILKGWFDRVWGPGIAFDHSSDLGSITPRLNALRHVLAVTTLGSPWWVDRLVMRQPVKRVLKLALLGGCARRSKLEFLSLYNCEKLTEGDVQGFGKKVTQTIDRWPV